MNSIYNDIVFEMVRDFSDPTSKWLPLLFNQFIGLNKQCNNQFFEHYLCFIDIESLA